MKKMYNLLASWIFLKDAKVTLLIATVCLIALLPKMTFGQDPENVYTIPAWDGSQVVTICAGGTVTVYIDNSENGNTYRIRKTAPSPASTLTNLTGNGGTISYTIDIFSGTGNYTIAVRDASDDDPDMTFTVSVVADPVASTMTKSPTLATVCNGQNVSASVNVAGTGGVSCSNTYFYRTNGGSWQSYNPGDAISTPDGTTSVDIKAVRGGCGGSGCDEATNTYSWAVNAQPAGPSGAVKTPNLGTVCDGTNVSATFTAGTGGVGCSDSYQYSTDGGSNWFAYTPGDPISTTGKTSVIIQGKRDGCTSGSGCTGTSWATLATWTVVNDFAMGTQPVGATICAGETHTMTVSATGGVTPYSYQWQYYNGVTYTWSNLIGANSDSYTTESAPGTTNSYRCLINSASGSGCTELTSNTVFVTERPTFVPGGITNGTQTICYNFFPSLLSVSPIGGSGTFDYRWYYKTTGSWTLIPSATGSGYQPGNLTETTMFRCEIDPTGSPDCGTWTAASPDATITVTPLESTVYVDDDYTSGTPGWGCYAFNKIQDAVNRLELGAGGGTINVAAGTYTENIVLSKAVTLKGANFGTPGCDVGRGAESIIAGSTGTAVTIAANNVTVDGFELTGLIGVSNTGYAGVNISNNDILVSYTGIAMNGISTASDGFTLQNNCIDLSGQLAGANPTVGIALIGINGAIPGTVSGNILKDAYYGYVVYNLTTGADITGGTITGCMLGVAVINAYPPGSPVYLPSLLSVSDINMSSFTIDHAFTAGEIQAGVYVFTGGASNTAKITMTVENVSVDGTGKLAQDWMGMSFADFSTASATLQDIMVTECTISNNKNRGINVRGVNADVEIQTSTLTNNGDDPYGTGGNHGYGIMARTNSTVSVHNCIITNPSSQVAYSVTALASHDGALLSATNNKLDNNGNPAGKLATFDGSGTFTGECNWWGSADGDDIFTNISGSVDFDPWLVDGTDNGNPGFVPLPGKCTGTAVVISSATPHYKTCAELGSIDVFYNYNSVNAPYSVAWTRTEGGSGSTGGYNSSPAGLTGLADGTYTLTVSDNFGNTSASFGPVIVSYLPVTNVTDDPDSYYATIQAAVSAADDYDHIVVCDGLYKESNITVNKKLTIEGQSKTGVVIAPAAANTPVNSSFPTGYQYAFLLGSGDVTIQNLTIDGEANTDLGSGHNFHGGVMTDHRLGILYNNITVQNIIVQHTYRRGIQIFSNKSTKSTGHLVTLNTVKDVTVGPGITIFDGDNTISNNTVQDVPASSGIEQVQWTAPGPINTVIKGNMISNVLTGIQSVFASSTSMIGGTTPADGNTISLSGADLDIGIILRDAIGGATVQNNIVTGSNEDAGIWLYREGTSGNPVLVKDNTLSATSSSSVYSGCATGILATDDKDFVNGSTDNNPVYASISGNTITGFQTGVELHASGTEPVGMVSASIQSNVINGSATAIYLYDHNGATNGYSAEAVINNNNLGGNTLVVDASGIPGSVVNATCNWWGTNDYTTIIPLSSGKVSFVPYLQNSTIVPGPGYDCSGGPSVPFPLTVSHNSSNQEVSVLFDVTAGNQELYPMPGNPTDPAVIAARYYALAAAIAGGNPATIKSAAMDIGDDVITEYYYMNGPTKVYLKTAGNNDLVKNKYWSDYLNRDDAVRFPNWTAIPPRTLILKDRTYSTTTSPLTGAVSANWLDPVRGKTMYVTVTLIQNGNVNSITQSVPIPLGPVNVYSASPPAPGNWVSSHLKIQDAINYGSTLNGYVVTADEGTYAENVTISKSLDIRGPNYNISPNTGTRVAEAIVVPASINTSTGAVFTITSSNVSINGFTLDGDNSSLGVIGSHDAARGVNVESDGLNNVKVENNYIQSLFESGVRFSQLTNWTATSTPPTPPATLYSYDNLINDNKINDISGNSFTIGVYLRRGMYTKVSDNTITNAQYGIYFTSFRVDDLGNPANRVISGNIIQVSQYGIWPNLYSARCYSVSNNDISAIADASITTWYGILMATCSAPQNFLSQTNLPKVTVPENWVFSDNTINGSGTNPSTTAYGVWLYYVDNNRDDLGVDHFNTFTGGSISNVDVGLSLKNKDTDPATNFGTSGVGCHAAIDNIDFIIKSGGKGIRLLDDATWTTGNPAPLINKRTVALTLGTDVSITGGDKGIVLDYPPLSTPGYTPYEGITGNSFNNLTYSGQTGNYIELNNYANNIDGSSVMFDGETGASADLAENFAIEDKIVHKLDNSALGFVKVKDLNDFVTQLSGSVRRGVDAASSGWTVNINSGLFLESNIAVNKPLSVIGVSKSGVVIAPQAEDSHTNSSFGGTYQYGFLLGSGNVIIKNLTLDGNANTGLVGDHHFRAGVMTDHRLTTMFNNITVEDVIVQHTFRRGIQLFSGMPTNSTGHIITGNTLTDLTIGPAIAVFDGDAMVTNNVINDVPANSGIEVVQNMGPGSINSIISSNMITNVLTGIQTVWASSTSMIGGPAPSDKNTITLPGTGYGIGIILRDAVGGATVQNNIVTGSNEDAGIWLYREGTSGNPVLVKDNTLTSTTSSSIYSGCATGILATDDRDFVNGSTDNNPVYAAISGNTITGFQTGVELHASGTEPVGMVSASILNNEISGSATAIYLYDHNGATNGYSAEAIINDNNLSGNTLMVDASSIPGSSVNANCNWWGSNVGNTIASYITGPVDYDPWLVDGTDGGDPGFVPLPGKCTGTTVIISSATPHNKLCGVDGSIDVYYNYVLENGPYTVNWTRTEGGGGSTGGYSASPATLIGLAEGHYMLTVEDNFGTTSASFGPVEILYLPVTLTHLGSDSYYATIQAAVNASADNDVVNVCAGTYKEQVIVAKGISIIGDVSNPDNVIIDGENKTNLPSVGQVRIYNPTGIVTFKGFKFINTGLNSSGDIYCGIMTKSSHAISIQSCKLYGHGATLDPGWDYAFWAYGSNGTLEIKDCYMTAFYHGILLERQWGACTIQNNTFDSFFTGLYSGSQYGGRGIEAIIYAETDVTSLQRVTGNNFINFKSSGIQFSGGFSGQTPKKFTNVEIDNNDFNFIATDIVNSWGAISLKNVSSGNNDPNGGVTANIHNNNINVPTVASIKVSGRNGSILCNNNSLVDNGVLQLDASASLGPQIDATCNWWDSDDYLTILSKLSGSITFMPYLVVGTEEPGQETTAGFQPLTPNPCALGAVAITSATPDHITCGETEGSVAVVFTGGTGPFNIGWTGPESGSANNITSGYVIPDLGAGSYTITVYAVGSQATTTATIELKPVTNVTDDPDTYYVTIQDAINAPTTANGEEIQICTGTYTENVVVSKELTITGAGQANTIIIPSFSAPNPGGGGSLPPGSSNVILVQADNVTIRDITIDGNNPSISSGVTVNSVDIDARNGIYTDHRVANYSNLTVKNTTVRNVYLRGIAMSTYGTFDFEDNTLTNIDGDPNGSIAVFNFGGTGSIKGNVVSYANDAIAANHSQGTLFENNEVTHSGSGIHSDNNGSMGGTADEILLNNVSLGTTYGYGIWVFAPYRNVSVHDNVISDMYIGLSSWGQQASVTPVFELNNVQQSLFGVYSTTSLINWGSTDVQNLFKTNTINNNDYGFVIEAETGYSNTTSLTTNNNINDNTFQGIYISGSGTSVTVANNATTISGNLVGIHVDDGANLTSCTGNTITNNTEAGIHIESDAGTIGAIENNTISGNGDMTPPNHGIGIQNDLTASVDASPNWWGDATGPYHGTLNNCGTGNAVAGDILFNPWFSNSGMTLLNGLPVITLSAVPDYSTIINTPVVISETVTYPDLTGYDPAVLTDARITTTTAFPAGVKVIKMVYTDGANPPVIIPISPAYDLAGLSQVYLSDILGTAATPLVGHSNKVINWQIYITGATAPAANAVSIQALSYLIKTGCINNLGSPSGFDVVFNDVTFSLNTTSVSSCNNSNSFTATNIYPVIENIVPDVTADARILSDIDIPAGAVIDWIYNGGAASGSYTLPGATSDILLSTIVANGPIPLVYNNSLSDIWGVTIHGAMLEGNTYNLTIHSVATLDGTEYTYNTRNIELIYYNIPALTITDPATVCYPATVDITAAAVTAGSDLPATTSLTYWNDPGCTNPLSDPDAVAVSGTYYIKATTSPGGCYDVEAVVVTIDPLAVGGTISPAKSMVCLPTNSGTLALSGYTGTILRWEMSTDNGVTWSPIANTTNTLTFTDISQTTKYRAVVHSGVCPADAISSIATVYTGVVSTISSLEICAGKPIDVPVKVESFFDVEAISLVMKYDNSLLQYVDATINPAIWLDPLVEYNGLITAGGFGPPTSLADDAVLFTLHFLPKSGFTNGSTAISFQTESSVPPAPKEDCEYGVNFPNPTPPPLYEILPYCDLPNSSYYFDGVITVQPVPVVSAVVTGPDLVPISMTSGNSYAMTICSDELVTVGDPTSTSIDPAICGPLRVQMVYTTTIPTLPPTWTVDVPVAPVYPDYPITPQNQSGIPRDINFVATPYYDADNSGSLTAGDVTGLTVIFTLTVNPAVSVVQPVSQVVCNGSPTTQVDFSGIPVSGTVYNWTNDNTTIGLAVSSGVGSIPSFIGSNSGTVPNVATFTVTPSYTNAGKTCYGTPKSFTITVAPQPDLTVTFTAPVPGSISTGGPTTYTQTVCSGSSLAATSTSLTPVDGLGNPLFVEVVLSGAAGLLGPYVPGTFEVPYGSLIFNNTLVNNTSGPLTVTAVITPYFETNPGNTGGMNPSECQGTPVTFTITVAPAPDLSVTFTAPVAGTISTSGPTSYTQTVCSGSLLAATSGSLTPVDGLGNPLFVQVVLSGAAGLLGPYVPGTFEVPYGSLSFNNTLVNNTTGPLTVTAVITPYFETNPGNTGGMNPSECQGTPVTFTITVAPAPDLSVTFTAPVAGTISTSSPTSYTQTVCSGSSLAATPSSNTPVDGLGNPLYAQVVLTGDASLLGSYTPGTFWVPYSYLVFNNTLVNNTDAPMTVTAVITPYFETTPYPSATGGINSWECAGIPITFTITVAPSPNLSVTFTAPVAGTISTDGPTSYTQTVCSGSSLSATPLSSTPVDGLGNPLYAQVVLTGDASLLGSYTPGTFWVPYGYLVFNNTLVNNTTGPLSVTAVITPYFETTPYPSATGGINSWECAGTPITFTITVNPLPVCSIDGDGPVCPNSSTEFTAPDDMTYVWTVEGAGTIVGADDEQDVTILASSSCSASYKVKLTITDVNGCVSICEKTISVQDVVAPVITTVAGSLDHTLQCSDLAGIALALTEAPVATDNCTLTPTIHLISDVTTPDISCANAYVRVRTWNFDDGCGNTSSNFVQTITVIDNTTPTITCKTSQTKTAACYTDKYVISGTEFDAVSAIDNCGGTVTMRWVFSGATVNSGSTSSINGEILNLGTTTITWYGKDVCDNEGSCSFEVTVNEAAKYSVSGILTYYNPANTPLNNLTGGTMALKLVEPISSTVYTSTIPSGSNAYSLSNVCPNTYDVVIETSKTAGGINSTDAAQVNQWGVSPYSIQKVRFYAGNVIVETPPPPPPALIQNLNSGDAAMILQYFVTSGNPPIPFPRDWTFWRTGDAISANPAPEYDLQINVAGTMTQNFYGMCTGDFNRSFVPGVTKDYASETMTLNYGQTKYANLGEEFDLPIYTESTLGVGAVSLILNYPSDKLEVVGVYLTDKPDTPLMFNVKGDELRIGWTSLTDLAVKAGDQLLTLKLRMTGNLAKDETLRFELAENPLNELATSVGEVIRDVMLRIDVIGQYPLGVDPGASQSLQFSSYPNPFLGIITFAYSLPAEGKVTLELRNALGMLIRTISENEQQVAGDHRLTRNFQELPDGVYFVTLNYSSVSMNVIRTIKIVRNH